MKWVNHTIIGGATCAVVAPHLAPVAILGATAPDWMEWVGDIFGRRVRHRGPTHWVVAWCGALVFFLVVWDWRGIGAAFAWGGVSHVLCDAFTVAGVPLAPWSDRRFHLLGGRLRTGGSGEYVVAAGVALVCWLIAGHLGASGGYMPFFTDWPGLYEQGIISPYEWRMNRFRLF